MIKRATFAGAVCAVALTAHAAPSEASCQLAIRWGGSEYLLHGRIAGHPPLAELTKRALVPTCNDTVDPDGKTRSSAPTDEVVRRVRGVDPAIAISMHGGVWINTATFTALTSHPLHNAIPGAVSDIAGAACEVTGAATVDVWGSLTVGGATVFVQPGTTVALQRHGTGFIPRGTKVRVSGSACETRDGERRVKARRIARA